MAESGSDGSWWGGWLQTAKEKSAMALEFMKKDLTEFSEVMQRDTSTVATSVKEKITKEQATAATKKVKDGMSSFLGGISKALTIPPDDDYQALVKTSHGMEPIYDRTKARLIAIQLDPDTYLIDPEGPQQDYEEWQKDFIIENKKGDISALLVANAEVRSLYTQMVPSSVSHSNFWQRYFYKVHQLEVDRKRRAALMKRADDAHDQQLEWDDMDDWDDIAGPPSPVKMKTETEISDNATPAAEPSSPSSVQIASPAADTQSPAEKAPEQETIQAVPETAQPTIVTRPQETGADHRSPGTSTPTLVEVSSGTSSPEMLASPSQTSDDIKVKDKGDMVIVATDRNTPSSDSTNKESSSLDDDWEKEFDLEVTEEDLRLAQEAAKMLKEKGIISQEGEEENDWENWD